jgi:hypothetical protein
LGVCEHESFGVLSRVTRSAWVATDGRDTDGPRQSTAKGIRLSSAMTRARGECVSFPKAAIGSIEAMPLVRLDGSIVTRHCLSSPHSVTGFPYLRNIALADEVNAAMLQTAKPAAV